MKRLFKVILTATLSFSLFSCKKKNITQKHITGDALTGDKDYTKSGNKTKSGNNSRVTTNKPTKTTIIPPNTDIENKLYRKEGNNIYFGVYPQSLETSTDKISTLESKIEAFDGPANATSKGWIKQTDYASNSTREAYYYRDIDLNDDGEMEYRAVHIYRYKNYNTSQPYSTEVNWYHDTETFTQGSTYYFRYEEIKWDILEEKDGKAYLFASLALDASYYECCTDNKDTKYMHGGNSGYANNYELSSIRKWLNNTFYNMAFNDLQKEIINQTTIFNNLQSTLDDTNEYICKNTQDNVFLLSAEEVIKYFETADDRTVDASILTNYALCQDANYEETLLRSPYRGYAYEAKVIRNNQYTQGSIGSTSVNYALFAIRPAIVITL